MKTKHISGAGLLLLSGALVLANPLAQAQLGPPLPEIWDNCVRSALQAESNSVVPFKMVSSTPAAGPVAYAGSSTSDNLKIGSFGFSYLHGYLKELFDNRTATTVPPFGGVQPFNVANPNSIYLQIFAFQGQIIVYIADQTAGTTTSFQGQCGGPGNSLLYGSDNTAMYLISLGAPQYPPVVK